MQSKIKYSVMGVSIAIFVLAMYYLSSEIFLAVFAGVLFLVPVAISISIIQSMTNDTLST